MPEPQRPALITEALRLRLQQVSMQIHEHVKVCTLTIAAAGLQEQAWGPNAQGFTNSLQRQPIGQNLGQSPHTMDSRVLPAKLL